MHPGPRQDLGHPIREGRVDQLAFAPGYQVEYEPSFILRGLAALDVEIKKRG